MKNEMIDCYNLIKEYEFVVGNNDWKSFNFWVIEEIIEESLNQKSLFCNNEIVSLFNNLINQNIKLSK